MQNDDTTVAQPSATSSNTGPVLAELAERAARHYSRSTESWLACADVLLEARGLAGHGEWLPFLAQAGIPARTAQRMIRLARAGIEMRHVTHLGGIATTLELLAAYPGSVAELVALDQQAEELREQIAIREANMSPEERVLWEEALADLREIRRLKRELNGWQSKHAEAQRENKALRRHHKELDKEIAALTAEVA